MKDINGKEKERRLGNNGLYEPLISIHTLEKFGVFEQSKSLSKSAIYRLSEKTRK